MLGEFIERLKPIPRKATVKLSVDLRDKAATVRLGDLSFQISSNIDGPLQHPNCDFALFGAVLIALRKNWDIETDIPVTAKTVNALRMLIDTFDGWRVRDFHPIRLTCTNLVDLPAPSTTDGVICLSGGVDSVCGAINERQRGTISHGLLLAGADYPSKDHPGFIDLRRRVETMAGRIDVTLFCVETTIRQLPHHWDMGHCLVLAMALAFHSSRFGHGVIAADYVLAQEYGAHPTGNNRPLLAAIGAGSFPLAHTGEGLTRAEKIATIAAFDPDLLNSLSVCYRDTSSGGNCGTCEKCIRTKLCFQAAGVRHEPYFRTNPPLVDQIAGLGLPKKPIGRRREYFRYMLLLNALPEGAEKEALRARQARLRRRITPTGKF